MSAVPDQIDVPEGLTYGEPVWDIARLYPPQGCWTEAEYLELNTNQLVEFSDGFVEFLPMPKLGHQLVAHVLHCLLEAFVLANGLGTVGGAPYRVRLWQGKYCEPDVIFVSTEHASRLGEDFADGADLVMEIVSGGESDRRRDLVKKRAEYMPGPASPSIGSSTPSWVGSPSWSSTGRSTRSTASSRAVSR